MADRGHSGFISVKALEAGRGQRDAVVKVILSLFIKSGGDNYSVRTER